MSILGSSGGCSGSRWCCARRRPESAAEPMRPYLMRALRVAALAGPLIALASAYADQWSVEKAGFNLYRITGHGMPAGQDMFVRTEGCDDAPAAGVVDIRKDGATRRLTFNGSSVACDIRDFLVPAK